jgi:hypothetical protein
MFMRRVFFIFVPFVLIMAAVAMYKIATSDKGTFVTGQPFVLDNIRYTLKGAFVQRGCRFPSGHAQQCEPRNYLRADVHMTLKNLGNERQKLGSVYIDGLGTASAISYTNFGKHDTTRYLGPGEELEGLAEFSNGICKVGYPSVIVRADNDDYATVEIHPEISDDAREYCPNLAK